MSYLEQGYDRGAGDGRRGRSTSPPSSTAANDAYEARFGFRYCVFVAGRPREALLPGMTAALDADRDAELHRALDAVVDIAIDRRPCAAPRPPEADR